MAEEDKQDKGAVKKSKLKPKKVPEKSNNCQPNNLKRKQEPADSPSSKSPAGPPSFVPEIQSMMYAFGDAPKPLVESAQLIESVLRQQMHTVLSQAADIAESRGSRQIMIEDLIFLFRKDKVKLKRFLRYYQLREIRSIASATEGENPEEILGNQQQNKKSKALEEFLIYLDPSLAAVLEEEVFDEVKHIRNLRCERRSQQLTQQQYLQWCQARATSFCPRLRTSKLRDWLLRDSPLETKPHPSTYEVLNYIAYEIVAEIVDLCLLVMQDSGYPRRVVNPELVPLLPLPPTPSSPPPSPDGSAPPKAKKRKKIEVQDCGVVRKISPRDIMEVLARYWRPHGPFHLFSRGYQPVKKVFCF